MGESQIDISPHDLKDKSAGPASIPTNLVSASFSQNMNQFGSKVEFLKNPVFMKIRQPPKFDFKKTKKDKKTKGHDATCAMLLAAVP